MATEYRAGHCHTHGLTKVERYNAGWEVWLGMALVASLTCGLGALFFAPKFRPHPWHCRKCGDRARAFEKEV
jgi:hypothetical protein